MVLNKEIELIEERVLSAAKDYVNYIDGSFCTKLFKEVDTNYIYKTDLINKGLLIKKDIIKLDTFAQVKGELLKDDKIKYTVEYIDAEREEYTNEELYLMIQNITNNGEGSTFSGMWEYVSQGRALFGVGEINMFLKLLGKRERGLDLILHL